VRLLLDAHVGDGNALTASRVIDAGGECRVSGSDMAAAHWKLLVIDDRTLAVGSGNLIWLDAPRDRMGRVPPFSRPLSGTREWWTLSDGADPLTCRARQRFEEAWSRAVRPPPRWRDMLVRGLPAAAVGCPQPQVAPLEVEVGASRLRLVVGARGVQAELHRMIADADDRIFATTPYVHPRVRSVAQLLDAMESAMRRGRDVRLLLGERPRACDARRLALLNFPVRHMDPVRATRGHAKGLVTERAALVGSANWSAGGLEHNQEAALVAASPGAVAYFGGAVLRDWGASTPL